MVGGLSVAPAKLRMVRSSWSHVVPLSDWFSFVFANKIVVVMADVKGPVVVEEPEDVPMDTDHDAMDVDWEEVNIWFAELHVLYQPPENARYSQFFNLLSLSPTPQVPHFKPAIMTLES